jgi:hypothetical protein
MAASGAAPARADEPLFGFVYTTDLLPRDQWEVEQWLTWRAHKKVGTFNVLEIRHEVEYGLTDALQIAAYLNWEWAEAHDNNVIDGTTLPPETFANVAVAPNENVRLTKLTGVAGEAIFPSGRRGSRTDAASHSMSSALGCGPAAPRGSCCITS